MKKQASKPNEESPALPIVTSLSLVAVEGGWSVLTIKSQGLKVISVDATPADMKAIAFEHYRIQSARLFMN